MNIHGVTGDLHKDGALDDKRSKGRNWRQLAAVKRVLEYWRTHGHEAPYPMLALPTGFGKGHIIHRLLREKPDAKILVIVGSKNILLDQSKEVLVSLAKQEAGTTDYSVFPITTGKVVLATWQGLTAAWSRHGLSDLSGRLVIVDEGHNAGTWKRLQVLHDLQPFSVVGLTATAYRSSGAYKWPNEYGFEIVDAMPLPECILQGWLSPMAGIAIDTQVLLPPEVRNINGFNYKKLNKALRNHPHLFESIATEIGTRFLPSGMKTVVVVNRIDQEACVMARILKQMGYKVGLAVNQAKAHELSDEFTTLDAIRRYKLPPEHPDSIQVLISPQVIGEGFDAPMTECVVWAAPTMSALRYTQVVGRGTRVCPGKRFCLIVDFVYMIENYGYSYNFAQFMPMDVLHELPGGVMYVGPEYAMPSVVLPAAFTDNARIVSMVNLQQPGEFPQANNWLTMGRIRDITGLSPSRITKILENLGIKPETRVTHGHVVPHYPPESIDHIQKYVASYPQAGDWMTLERITREVGKAYQWCLAQLRDFSQESQTRWTDNAPRPTPHYPPWVVEELKRRAKATPEADGWILLSDIAEAVGRSPKWVEIEIAKLNVQPETRLSKTRRELPHYPPHVLETLRVEASSVTPAGDWLPLETIGKQIGRSPAWVKKQLDEAKFETEERRFADGKVLPHYPPSALDFIKKLDESVPEAKNWLNLLQLSSAIGRSSNWVSKRLSHVSFKSQLRKTNGSLKAVPHYPPSILEHLKKAAKAEEELPRANGWLTVRAIAKALDREERWVVREIAAYHSEVELRMDPKGRTFDHYPPSVLEKLRATAESAPPAGDYLSLGNIADKLGEERHRIKKLIKHVTVQPEKRLGLNGRISDHYPPEVTEQVKKLLNK